MDNYETISNCSDHSDGIKSNASTLSGLSGYQNEFAELRHLVNPSKYPNCYFERSSTPTQDLSYIEHEERISQLSNELQNSLKLNEKYKNKLGHVEKQIELKFYNKIEKLLRNNNQLEVQLENANAQIKRLIKNYSNSKENIVLSEKFNLEKQCHGFVLENSHLKKELCRVETGRDECELENKKLKIALNDVSTENEVKNGCIKELKDKISEQHVEIQTLMKGNSTLTNRCSDLKSELEHVKKSKEWYKEQLHLSQKDKQTLAGNILEYKTKISAQNNKIKSLSVELTKSKNQCDQIELEALREKETLLKKLETLNLNAVSTSVVAQLPDQNDLETIKNYYETTIHDLTKEISRIKANVQEDNLNFQRVNKENSGLISKLLMLQKTVQNNESIIEMLENNIKDISMKLSVAEDREKKKSKELADVKEKEANLIIELTARNQEREMIESTINTIREQFFKFKTAYEKLKEELHVKNRHILELQREKQKLFMNNNWTICELEKTKEKDIVISKLKDQISNCEKQFTDLSHNIKELEKQLQENEEIIKEKEHVVQEKNEEIKKYENVLCQYKNMVTDYENRLSNLQKTLNKNEEDMVQLKENIQILKDEVNKRDFSLVDMQNSFAKLENDYGKINMEKDKLFEESKTINTTQLTQNNVDEILTHIFKSHSSENRNGNTNGNIFSLNQNDAEFLKLFVEKMQAHLQENCNRQAVENKTNIQYINKLKSYIGRLKNEVTNKIDQLESRTKFLQNKCEENGRILKLVLENTGNCQVNEKIQELKVILQVKELELKEKDKKYTTNNRTLLRKVKEHMKGRNTAEKHNSYLQELYNALSDEHNTLKLTLSSREYEIESLNKMSENYRNENEKLRHSVLNLEKEVNKNRICEECVELVVVRERLVSLEKHLNEIEESRINTQNEVISKDKFIIQLQNEIQDLQYKNSKIEQENTSNINKIKELNASLAKLHILEKELQEKSSSIEDLRLKLLEEEENCRNISDKNEKLEGDLQESFEKIQYLSSEIQLLSVTLQEKTEESKRMEISKLQMEEDNSKKEHDNKNIIMALKNHLQATQGEINSMKSDKYFLQRLSNDLKVALKSHVNYIKILKEQIENLSKERQDFSSLPNKIVPGFPSPSKYDETYVTQLLQQNRAPLQDKPLAEVQACLDTLRKEIFTLQERILLKNLNGSQ